MRGFAPSSSICQCAPTGARTLQDINLFRDSLGCAVFGVEGLRGDDAVADVVVGGHGVAAQEGNAELDEAGAVAFGFVGGGADDGAVRSEGRERVKVAVVAGSL